MRQRHILWLTVAAATLLSVVVHAQSNKWDSPYDKGVKAIDAQNYSEAIIQIERAVAVNAKAEANKKTDGVFTRDYFPYHYLAIAYLELKQYDKAQQNFEKAKAVRLSERPMGAKTAAERSLRAKFPDYQGQLQAALAAPKPGPGPAAPPAAPRVNAAFEPALRRGEQAFAARRFNDALDAFDAAKAADGAEYARQGVQARRDDSARAMALQLADEGSRMLPESLTAAKDKFQQAERAFGGLKPVTDGLADVQRREDQYAQLKRGAEQDVNASNWRPALSKLDQAKGVNPEQFTADNLTARVSDINRRMNGAANDESKRLLDERKLLDSQEKYAALVNEGRILKDKKGGADTARKRLEEARTLDPQRFERDGLGPTLNALLTAAGQDPVKESLRQALLALLNGDAQGSIAILEPAVSQSRGAAASTAPLHAYLGVAYATRALTSAKPDDKARLSDVAIEQFKLALSSQRDYQLSPRLVSPKILAMFEQARR